MAGIVCQLISIWRQLSFSFGSMIRAYWDYWKPMQDCHGWIRNPAHFISWLIVKQINWWIFCVNLTVEMIRLFWVKSINSLEWFASILCAHFIGCQLLIKIRWWWCRWHCSDSTGKSIRTPGCFVTTDSSSIFRILSMTCRNTRRRISRCQRRATCGIVGAYAAARALLPTLSWW